MNRQTDTVPVTPSDTASRRLAGGALPAVFVTTFTDVFGFLSFLPAGGLMVRALG